MVALRHLVHFGYKPTLVYPKRPQRSPFQGLLKQCESLQVPILEDVPDDLDKKYHLIVDAVFGYSFSGDIR